MHFRTLTAVTIYAEILVLFAFIIVLTTRHDVQLWFTERNWKIVRIIVAILTILMGAFTIYTALFIMHQNHHQ